MGDAPVMAIGKITRGRIVLDDTAPQVLVPYRDNADLIAYVARLGYLDGTVLDATYGLGTFWKDFKPDTLITNDLYKPADHAWDFLDLPCRDGEFDSVVYDPDYKLNGTPALPEMDDRYGVGEDMKAQVREHYNGEPRLILGGPGEGLTIETEVVWPPSSQGKRIPVYVDADMVEKLLLEFRRHAARRRSGPLSKLRRR